MPSKLLPCLLLTAASTFVASTGTRNPPCPENKFFDHVTLMCESCFEICDLADIKGTVQQCQDSCPTVYNRMYVDNQLRKPEVVLASSLTQSDPPSSESPSSIPTITVVLITIGVFIIIAFAIVGGAALYRHSQNAEDAPSATEAGRPTSARYSPANVQETGDKTAGERRSQGVLRGMCDPRGWFSQVDHDSVHGEETSMGRQGTQQLALLGNSQGSGIQETSQQKPTYVVDPIYKPSGSMRSTRI